jgi:hypothetical protein
MPHQPIRRFNAEEGKDAMSIALVINARHRYHYIADYLFYTR